MAARLGARRPAPTKLYDPDIPEMGCYRVRLRRGAPDSAVRIWLGHSVDPATGEEMLERPILFQCELNGQRVQIEQCWPGCARESISREEHDRIAARNRDMDPESPFFDPLKRVDLKSAPAPF